MTNDVRQYVEKCLRDTGFFARTLLGYNYDEDGPGGARKNVGTGGIVDHGKTQEIITLLDDESIKFKLVKAPRESRKSTILQCFVLRNILLNPDVRIFYAGRTDQIVRDKALAIRNQLERDEIRQLFGEQRGDTWEETRFTVAGRKNQGLQNATFQAFSMDSLPVGGRADIVILDDFIDDTNVTNSEQNKKAKQKFAHIQPFIAKGGMLVVVGTTWADDDLYADCESMPLFAPPLGGQVICGAGVRVVTDTDGRLDLEVEPTGLTFPHLTREYLLQKLHGMAVKGQTDLFCRQYLNEATSRQSSMFNRKMFQPLAWADDMQQLTGFLVTDTATSKEDEGCYSVIGYVGLDAVDNIYLLDLRVGHWDPSQFVNVFFDVLETWQGRVNHAGECWEKISMTTWAMDLVEKDSRARKTRLRSLLFQRYAKNRKAERILRLHGPMLHRHFFVCDTVPKTFEDLDGTRELWNPEGFWDARTKTKQASGELVDEFLKATSKKDIPDALAMVLEYESAGGSKQRRICSYKPWRPKAAPTSLTDQRKNAYHQAEYRQSESDWWERTLNDHGI